MYFISFFTDEGRYPQFAERLGQSLVKFGLPHCMTKREARGSWKDTIATKPRFILRALLTYRCPVVWLDADTTIMQLPSLLYGPEDFAAFNWTAMHRPPKFAGGPDGLKVSGGVLKFGYTAGAIDLLMRWMEQAEQEPNRLDDPNLDLVYNETRPPVIPLWLPPAYNRMHGHFPNMPVSNIVIDHEWQPREEP